MRFRDARKRVRPIEPFTNAKGRNVCARADAFIWVRSLAKAFLEWLCACDRRRKVNLYTLNFFFCGNGLKK